MDQRADTPDKEPALQTADNNPWQGKIIVSALMGCIVFGFFLAFGWLNDRMSCVEMPNGFLIGRATVFSSLQHTEQGLPDIAIRYPDGRLFSRGDISVDFWDADGLGGRFSRGGRPDHLGRFVYLNNAGLVMQEKQPELFKQYFSLKDREWREKGRIGANLYFVYSRLRENYKNRRSWCKTDLFLPKAME